ncbi:sigma-70 family RNA polymerase sigma factor [Altererythrobacter soli]|uniref:Sigma-70 family RNA polymerase sigma factor n=1 Tax=Croceibacterium soli TaxID=1739690 RepID=A0A6I4USF4_9SPHN|nr:RNA polymerase sigma factor [Croceibacterium soli]MXP41386.1 sigma-70 family RNA polymerase sigma factor [Croceibacterium soli]
MPETSSHVGLEAVFLANRERLLRFLAARGAGDAAEDLLQELWLRIAASRPGPVASPLSYLFRAADMLMIDRYRAETQTRKRERAWTEAAGGAQPGVSDTPSVERHIIGRENARLVAEAIDALGPRPAAVFRRHRVDGIPQRQVAEEIGVSLSTVESDLRRAYRALADLKERLDEG